jgi:hypothetical protein
MYHHPSVAHVDIGNAMVRLALIALGGDPVDGPADSDCERGVLPPYLSLVAVTPYTHAGHGSVRHGPNRAVVRVGLEIRTATGTPSRAYRNKRGVESVHSDTVRRCWRNVSQPHVDVLQMKLK